MKSEIIFLLKIIKNFGKKNSIAKEWKSKKCYILGNGPSLSRSAILKDGRPENSYCVTVNEFVFSDKFEFIKPDAHFIIDPMYFFGKTVQIENDVGQKVFSEIEKRTLWPMKLCVPFTMLNYVHRQTRRNRNIKLEGLNLTSGRWFTRNQNYLFSMGLAMPTPQNVLIPALMQVLLWKYKEIFILGGDHSWHESLYVSSGNEIGIKSNYHFYDNTEEVEFIKLFRPGSKDGYKLHEFFELLRITFEQYHLIERFACKRNQKIWNATPASYIDAFERKTID